MLLMRYIESFSYGEQISRQAKIEIGRKELFDFDYPFYDETKRQEFETHFIKHFYLRELGASTQSLFKFRLEDYLNLNMPYWNHMFQSELLNFPVFEDFDYTISEDEKRSKASQTDTDVIRNKNTATETDATKNKISAVDTDTTKDTTNNQTQTLDESINNQSDTTGTSNEDNFHRNIFTDTPAKDLQITANDDGTGIITTASTLEEDKDTKKSDSVGSQTDVNKKDQQIDTTITEKETKAVNTDKTENETRNIDTGVVEDETQGVNTDLTEQQEKENDKVFKGKKGNTDYADLLQKYRSTFMRIERDIFEEINKEGLFLLVYGGR